MESKDHDVYNTLLEPISPKPSKLPCSRLTATALLVAMGGAFNFGYQLLITNPSQEAFLSFVNASTVTKTGHGLSRAELESVWGWIISLFFWGCTAGALFIRGVAERLGRKNGLQLSHFLQILACGLSIASYYKGDHYIYAASRFLLGFSICLSLGISPMFITECSPASCRGVTSMACGVSLQVALVVGAVAAMPQLLGTVRDWWMLYAAEMTSTAVVMVLMPKIHESPGHLLSRGKEDESAASLCFYHDVTMEEARRKIKGMEMDSKGEKSMGLLEIWTDRTARRGMMVGCVVMLAMVMTGIPAINAFAFEILLSTGLTKLQASLGNIAICMMSVIGILSSSMVIDRYGRRLLLLLTYGMLALVNATIFGFMMGYQTTKSPYLGYCLVATICLFNLSFAAGPGPVSLFITGELVGQRARGAASTWVNLCMSVSRSLLLAGYMPLKNYIGQPNAYLLLFFPPMVITVAILFFHLPETKGKSVLEVQIAAKLLPRLRKKSSPVDEIQME